MAYKKSVRQVLNDGNANELAQVGLGDRLAAADLQLAWHGASDSANRLSLRSLTTLAQCVSLANALKVAWAAHIALGAPTHLAADATNTISASDATDLASAITLANELKEELNDHINLAAAHDRGSTTALGEATAGEAALDLINYVMTANAATLLSELIPLLDDIQKKYRRHTFIGPFGTEEILTLDAGV